MMRKTLYVALLASMLISCKPAEYVGPLDSPIGNWAGTGCEYFFNGELVAEADSSYYSAITFYKEGLCCIEGIKGAFPYEYDPQEKILQIDSLIWSVKNLHSEDLTLKYLGRIYPDGPMPESEDEETDEDESTEDQGPVPDKNGIILPVEYRGFTISADENDYFYIDRSGNTIYCTPVGSRNAEGLMEIALWYDTRTDRFGPLVVEVEKD